MKWDERLADTVRGFMIGLMRMVDQDTPEVYGSVADPCLGFGLRQIALFVKSQSTFVIIMIFGLWYRLAEISAVKKAYDRNPFTKGIDTKN